MSKYQEVMNHIEVDDEMKKRILQNVEKQLEEAPKEVDIPKSKVVPFRRYAAIAATFAVLLLGSYAVSQVTGGITNTSSSPSEAPAMMEEAASDSEAPAMEAAETAAEAPIMEEAASEAPVMEETSETATEAPAVENAAAETAAEEADGEMAAVDKTESVVVFGASSEMALQSKITIILIVLSVTVAALIIATIIMFIVKKRK